MSIQESTPGVYINEITGPGVIQGVGTSVLALLGPTVSGPANTPIVVTTYDRFAGIFGGSGPNAPHLVSNGRLLYLSLAVRGFFQNGGVRAYIVRVDNSTVGSLDLANADGTTVARVTAATPTLTPSVSVIDHDAGGFTVVSASVTIDGAPANPSPIPGDATNDVLVDDVSGFATDDTVTDGTDTVTVTAVSGNWLRLSGPVGGGQLTTAPLTASSTSLRIDGDADTLRVGSRIEVTNDTPASAIAVVDRVGGDRVTLTFDAGSPDIALAGTNPTLGPAPYVLASGSSAVTAADGAALTLADASPFRSGDTVTDGTGTAGVVTVDGTVVTLDAALTGGQIDIVDLDPARNRFRVLDHRGLTPGSVLRLNDDSGTETFGVVTQISTSGFVTLADNPARTATIAASTGRAALIERTVVVTDGTTREVFTGLTMSPTAARYLFTTVGSALVTITEPDPLPVLPVNELIPAPVADQALSPGVEGSPATLGAADYQDALDELQRIDEVNMVAAPDAASLPADLRRAVHGAMITHCLQQADRIALIDPPPGVPASGPGGIEEIRAEVQSERGFAALYYPWLQILDPTRVPPLPPLRIAVPPSGHVAGVIARTDTERGVHKAPANTPIRDVLGLERRLTDAEQAPLNRGGTNVLRILPGSSAVTVWGARTTVDPVVTDWIYLNVRRLLLFIEESIQESIRWAVFEPNDLGLWKALDRVIRAFLRQQWKAGALFGATEDDAFRVRIDEGLNPPEVRNIGRLNIEIRVAPTRPAEFIVITIGLFDGGSQVEEV